MEKPQNEPETVPSDAADEELAERIRQESEGPEAGADGNVSSDRAARYYDRIRGNIRAYLEKKGKATGKAGEFLLLVPDVFMLLWRLVKDGRVAGKSKV